jgi:membrane protease YdiL (CAAX protease family)
LLVFFAVGNLDGLSLPLSLRESEIKMVIRYTAGFCAIAIPLAVDSHFISFVPTFAPWKFIAVPVGIFFFVALPEELLFRGLLQNLLAKQWQHPLKAILVTSFIFGLSHVNNKPTWSLSYVGLATLAGVFYGAAYEKTKNLFVSALIHCAVDSIWILLFFGRG